MKTKELNQKQIRCLFNDILSQKVKRFGRYTFGKYGIVVNNKIPLTSAERVYKYYHLNPNKKVDINKKRRLKYNKRKNAGLCVKCQKGEVATRGVYCKRHHKQNKSYVL